jgi:hypothetical protein
MLTPMMAQPAAQQLKWLISYFISTIPTVQSDSPLHFIGLAAKP